MVDFINQEEPDVTVDESLEDFISCSGRYVPRLLPFLICSSDGMMKSSETSGLHNDVSFSC
ncbi:hypothetical protein O6H91_Y306500 [Diphasiastrum complanatum]|nr:hypothetical protein O6H91_Y306500 [Diphasiastrum complanatum]